VSKVTLLVFFPWLPFYASYSCSPCSSRTFLAKSKWKTRECPSVQDWFRDDNSSSFMSRFRVILSLLFVHTFLPLRSWVGLAKSFCFNEGRIWVHECVLFGFSFSRLVFSSISYGTFSSTKDSGEDEMRSRGDRLEPTVSTTVLYCTVLDKRREEKRTSSICVVLTSVT